MVLFEGPADVWVVACRGTASRRDVYDDLRITQATRFGMPVGLTAAAHNGRSHALDQMPWHQGPRPGLPGHGSAGWSPPPLPPLGESKTDRSARRPISRDPNRSSIVGSRGANPGFVVSHCNCGMPVVMLHRNGLQHRSKD